MKKILTFVLAISMVAILAACGGKDDLTVFKSKDNKYQVSASSSWKDANGELNPDSDLEIYTPQKENISWRYSNPKRILKILHYKSIMI